MASTVPSVRPEVLKTKTCLVGEQAVGKTSLIHRFVSGAFDESYIRTMGAMATVKRVDLPSVGARPVHVDLSILDIMGKQTFLDLFRDAYFRGAAGILAVADITRRSTLDALHTWIGSVVEVCGKLPVVLVVNKADLAGRAEVEPPEIEDLAKTFDASYFLTSAKTGSKVEDAFSRLAYLAAWRQLRLD